MRYFNLIILVLLLMSACQKDDQLYSCNPEIDKYVTVNLSHLAQLSLDEFLELDIPLQRAVFRSYTTERKLDFWMEKLHRTLLLGNWTEKEILHIKNLEDILNVTIFESYSKNQILKTEQAVFAKEWVAYSLNTLKWNKAKLTFVVSSLYYSETEFNQASAIELNLSITSSDCVCNMGMDFCYYEFNLGCKSSDCTASSSGCGWLWGDPCDGTCQQVQE